MAGATAEIMATKEEASVVKDKSEEVRKSFEQSIVSSRY